MSKLNIHCGIMEKQRMHGEWQKCSNNILALIYAVDYAQS